MTGPGPRLTARPGPVGRNEATEAFFDAAAAGRFLLARCELGHWNRPQADSCAECGSTALSFEASSGRARLVSWVVVHSRPAPDGTTGPPSVPAIVELEEGPWWWGPLVDVDPDELAEGCPLQVVFEVPANSETVPAFTTTG